MSKTAFLFPGQGSQTVGMGKDLAASSSEASAIFAEIDEALGEPLSQMMADGPAESLQLTENTQPAMFASSMAVLRALEAQSGQTLPELADYVAGHSLGEYSALCAASSLGVAETARLLRRRGRAMQKAVPVGEGAMAALLGADLDMAQTIIEKGAAAGLVQIANDNAPGQVVISGSVAGVHAAMDAAKDAGLRRVVELPVSAPFHCDLMAPAADEMATALADVQMRDAMVPVVCNVSVQAEQQAAELRRNLVTQVTGRVRWRETLTFLAEQNVTRFVEVGTGKVLSGLVKRTLKDVEIISLETAEDISGFLS